VRDRAGKKSASTSAWAHGDVAAGREGRAAQDVTERSIDPIRLVGWGHTCVDAWCRRSKGRLLSGGYSLQEGFSHASTFDGGGRDGLIAAGLADRFAARSSTALRSRAGHACLGDSAGDAQRAQQPARTVTWPGAGPLQVWRTGSRPSVVRLEPDIRSDSETPANHAGAGRSMRPAGRQ
jgi:hypothetical protein